MDANFERARAMRGRIDRLLMNDARRTGSSRRIPPRQNEIIIREQANKHANRSDVWLSL
jgi:hypothetical protein